MLKILAKIGVLTVSNSISQSLSFLFGIILVRHISIVEFSVYRQEMVIMAISSACIMVINPVSLGYFLPQNISTKIKQQYIMQSIFGSNILSLIGICLLLAMRTFVINYFKNPLLAEYYNAFVLWGFLESAVSFYAYFMITQHQIKHLAFMTILFSLARVAALIIAIKIGTNIFYNFVWINIYALVFKYLVMHIDVYKKITWLKLELSSQVFMNQLNFSIPIYLSTLMLLLNSNIDKIFVSSRYSGAQFGIYAIGSYDIPFIGAVGGSILSIMLPEISERYDQRNQEALNKIVEMYRKIIKGSFCFSFPLAFTLIIFAPEVIRIVFTAKYDGASNLFRIYCLTPILTSINLGALITGAGKQKQILKSGLLMLLSNIGLLILIRKWFGFNWLTLGPVLAMVFAYIYNLITIKSAYAQQSIFSLLPWRELLGCGIISFATGLLFRFSGLTIEGVGKWWMALGLVALYCTSVLLCWLAVRHLNTYRGQNV